MNNCTPVQMVVLSVEVKNAGSLVKLNDPVKISEKNTTGKEQNIF